jgi:hypothetical protein
MNFLLLAGRTLKKWWMLFAHALGWVNTRILLSIFYLIILAIPAIILRLLRRDPLRRSFHNGVTYWQEKPQLDHSMDRAKRQF